MKTNSKSAAQTPKEILTDLHALVAEAEKMLSEDVSEYTDEAVDSLRDRFEAAQARFAEVYGVARQKIVAGAKRTDIAIRENPYQALAIAAGAGLLIGLLVGRRSAH